MARGEVRYRLALETKAFTDGIKAAKQEAASLGNDLAGKLGKAGNILSAMGPAGMAAAAGVGAAAVAFGAVVTAVTSATSAAAKYADGMSALQDKTGLSVATLQKLEVAARLGNSSIESIASATNKMQVAITNGDKSFAKLGLSLSDLRTQSPDEQLRATAQAIMGLGTAAERTTAMKDVFGKSGPEMIGTLKALASGASELGGALSDEAVESAAMLQDNLDLLDTAMERVALQFGAAVAQSPELQRALQDLTDLAADFATGLGKAAPAIAKFFDGIVLGSRVAIAGLKALATAQNPLKVMDAWKGFQSDTDQIAMDSMFSDVQSGSSNNLPKPKRYTGKADDKAAEDAARAELARIETIRKARIEEHKTRLKLQDEMDKRNLDSLQYELKVMGEAASAKAALLKDQEARQMEQDLIDQATREEVERMKAAAAEAAFQKIQSAIQGISQELMGMGQVFGGVFGKILQSAGAAIGAFGQMRASLASIKTAGGGIGGFLQKASGAMGILGAGVSAFGFVKGLFGGKSKEEKAAEEAERKQKIEDTTKQIDDLKKKIDSIRLEKLSAGVTGLASLFRHMVGQAALTPEAIDRINVKMGKYKEKLKDLSLTEDEYKKKIKERRQELESAAEGADVEQMKQRMERLGIIGTAMFQALKKEGKSTVEAMREMGPAIDQAIAAAQAHGIEIGGTLGMLADFRQKVGANEDLVSAAEGLGSVMDALRATGSLTQETFNALQGELGTVFADLTAKGFTADQALALLAPTLLQIRDAARDGKIAVDEQTASLIRQAEAGGHFDGVKDPMKEMVELQKMMLELWAAIAQMQGVTLPDSLRAYIATLREASAAAAGVGVPGTAPVDAHQEGHSGPDGSTQSAGGFWNPSMPHGPLAGGGTNLVVHPGEEVSVTPRGRKGGGMGNVVLNVDGRAFARVQNNNTRKNRGGARSQGQRFIGSR
jgi:hypothetical protein